MASLLLDSSSSFLALSLVATLLTLLLRSSLLLLLVRFPPPSSSSSCASSQLLLPSSRPRSKSTSSLDRLLTSPTPKRVLRSGMGLISCLLDSDTAFPSSEKTRCSNVAPSPADDVLLHYDSADCGTVSLKAPLSPQLSESQQQPGTSPMSSQKPQKGKGGPSEGLMSSSCKPCMRSEPADSEEIENCMLPSWTFSLLKSLPSAASLSFHPAEAVVSKRAFSFEKQFGWDSFLSSRLGSAWQCSGQTQFLESRPGVVAVKVWSGEEKRLLETLKIDTAMARALAVGWSDGLACVGSKEGQVSLWDVERRIGVASFSSLETPVSALFMDTPSRITVGGTALTGRGVTVGLWDHRRAAYEPTLNQQLLSYGQTPVAALKCRTHELCVAGAGGLWMHDLRMLSGEAIVRVAADEARRMSAATVGDQAMEEAAVRLWEKQPWLAGGYKEDDEDWDECHTGVEELQAASSKPSSRTCSFMSRCATLLRSLGNSAATIS